MEEGNIVRPVAASSIVETSTLTSTSLKIAVVTETTTSTTTVQEVSTYTWTSNPLKMVKGTETQAWISPHYFKVVGSSTVSWTSTPTEAVAVDKTVTISSTQAAAPEPVQAEECPLTWEPVISCFVDGWIAALLQFYARLFIGVLMALVLLLPPVFVIGFGGEWLGFW